jgi:hypothetical protein
MHTLEKVVNRKFYSLSIIFLYASWYFVEIHYSSLCIMVSVFPAKYPMRRAYAKWCVFAKRGLERPSIQTSKHSEI